MTMQTVVACVITVDGPPGDHIATPISRFVDLYDSVLVGRLEVAPLGVRASDGSAQALRTELRFTLSCTIDEAASGEQYFRDLLKAAGVNFLDTGPVESVRYDGGSPEAFYRALAGHLTSIHGPLQSVEFATHYPSFEMWFRYKDGTRVYSGPRTGTYDIHFLTFGYVGEGPRYTQTFLTASGFSTSPEEVESASVGSSIQASDLGPAPDVSQVAQPTRDRPVGGRPRKWWQVWKRSSGKIQESETPGVTFVEEKQKEVAGAPATIVRYKADSKKAAISFLERQEVTAQSVFLLVETPEGTFGKDRMGMLE